MKNKFIKFFTISGLTWVVPLVKLSTGDEPGAQLKEFLRLAGLPILAFFVFVMFWSISASQIQTSLGSVPGPSKVWGQAKVLWTIHKQERAKADEFYAKQETLNQKKLSKNPSAKTTAYEYTGKPTYIDQIRTSLKTVFIGFVIASLVALPIGIFCGLSRNVMTALNPIVQILKPVSPLAWLPIVTMIVSALYATNDGFFTKSFIISAITVALCSLWATLINTALGVASVDKDYINVAKVLQLGVFSKIFKIVLPASLPLIFTGLRISLGIGWMVLIAAEMLAQNPGLGKFVWDEFQNGSADSLANIMVAVFTIGIIGFILDRVMVTLQQLVSFEDKPAGA